MRICKSIIVAGCFLTSLAFTTFSCSDDYDDSALSGRVDNLENRVASLEQLCKQMNTNIGALQTLVDALQNNVSITNVIPLTEDGKNIGYTISFTKGDPITIYHGQDGKDGQDGQNGTNGRDGITPVIGVRQDADGIYYWTLNGDWLTDDAGNKVKCRYGRKGRSARCRWAAGAGRTTRSRRSGWQAGY